MGSKLPNSAFELASFGQQRPLSSIGDGKVHTVKVVYVPFVAIEYVHRFSASPNMVITQSSNPNSEE